MQCNDYTKKRLRTQPVAARRPRFLEGDCATRSRGGKSEQSDQICDTLAEAAATTWETRAGEATTQQQRPPWRRGGEGDAGRGFQHIWRRSCVLFIYLFICTQITRIKTKTHAHAHHHIAHLHLPFGAGACQFPNKTGPSVADRASTRQRSLPDQSLSLCSILSSALEAICWMSLWKDFFFLLKKLHLGKLPAEFLESLQPLCCYFVGGSVCAAAALFASARDAQDGGLRVPDMQHAQ